MIAFIDEHRGVRGVEPICEVLPIAPSTYHAHAARRIDPSKAPARSRSDAELNAAIRRVWDANFQVHGVRKVWRQSRREGLDAARRTVARLMRRMGLKGATRGKAVRTTIGDRAAPRPNALWVTDFTHVATWRDFVIDTFARRIVGRRVSRTAHAGFVLDALEQAPHECRPAKGGGLIHHSDRGSQHVAVKDTERLTDAGVEPSVGSVGDSYDNALAETINGLYKTEVIRRRGVTQAKWPPGHPVRFMFDIEREINGLPPAEHGSRFASRGVALGRKAWLFAGSDRGGQRAAVMYGLIATAKFNDVDPQACLADALARVENAQKRRNDARSSGASASLTSERSYQVERSIALNSANDGHAGSPLAAFEISARRVSTSARSINR